MMVFSALFVKCCLSNVLSGSTLPPLLPFLVSKYSIYSQFVHGRGYEVLSPVVDNILQEFNTDLLDHPKQEN
jgi:hypothetical protein